MGSCMTRQCQRKTDQILINTAIARIYEEKTDNWPVILFNTNESIQKGSICYKSLISKRGLLKLIYYRMLSELFIINRETEYKKIPIIPLVITNSIDGGMDYSHLNLDNFNSKWNNIKFQGNVDLKSGWDVIMNKYATYIASCQDAYKSKLKIIFITDNDLQNLDDLEQCLRHCAQVITIEIIMINLCKGDTIYDQLAKKYKHVHISQYDNLNMIIDKLMLIFKDNCLLEYELIHKSIVSTISCDDSVSSNVDSSCEYDFHHPHVPISK